MKVPKRVGEPMELVKRVYGKTAVNQQFLSPAGEEYEYLMWDYKNGEPPVIVMALTENFDVIALRQYRHAANEIVTEVPGGCIIKGMSLEETAKKELLEETGFEAGRIVKLNQKPIWFEPSNLTVPYHAFLALDCKKVSEQKLDKTEYVEIEILDWLKWLVMIKEGEIRDSKTLALTLLAMFIKPALAVRFAFDLKI